MITPEQVKNVVDEILMDTEAYLVDLKVTPGNKITLFVDNDTRITLDEIVKINRLVEEKLNRDVEDFDLTVSSPGLDEPLKHLRQYKKRIGSQVAVVTKEGDKVIGKLAGVNDESVTVEKKSTERLEGKKGRQTVIESVNINFNQIKQTKLVLSF